MQPVGTIIIIIIRHTNSEIGSEDETSLSCLCNLFSSARIHSSYNIVPILCLAEVSVHYTKNSTVLNRALTNLEGGERRLSSKPSTVQATGNLNMSRSMNALKTQMQKINKYCV